MGNSCLAKPEAVKGQLDVQTTGHEKCILTHGTTCPALCRYGTLQRLEVCTDTNCWAIYRIVDDASDDDTSICSYESGDSGNITCHSIDATLLVGLPTIEEHSRFPLSASTRSPRREINYSWQ